MKVSINGTSARMRVDNVRLSFPKLFEPEAYKEGKPRYSACFIVEDKETHAEIVKAVQAVAKEAWGKKAAEVLEEVKHNRNKNCYVKSKREETEGCMILTAHRQATSGAPKVVGRGGKDDDITEESGRIYAGCYVNASVELYAQKGENYGIRCALIGVQFVKDGPAFAGTPATADDFDDLGDDGEAADFGDEDDDDFDI